MWETPYFLPCTRGIHSKKMTTIYTQESIQCLSIIGIYRRKSRFLWWKSNSFSFQTDLNEDTVDVSNCFFGFKIKCSLARKMTCDFAAWQSLFSCCKCILANVLSWDGVQFTIPVICLTLCSSSIQPYIRFKTLKSLSSTTHRMKKKSFYNRQHRLINVI